MRAGNARPYELESFPTKLSKAEWASLFPATVRRKNGFAGSFDTGQPQSPYSQVPQCAAEKPLSCFYKTPLSDLINGA